MLLKSLFEVVSPLDPKTVSRQFFEKRKRGIIYRFLSIAELAAILKSKWRLIGFDEYGEEEHDPKYDGMYFKSFSTKMTKDQYYTFEDDVLVAFDENELANINPMIKLIDYVYDENTEENEKRLISPTKMLPSDIFGGRYWDAIKMIYVPESKLPIFKKKVINWFAKHSEYDYLLPDYITIKGE